MSQIKAAKEAFAELLGSAIGGIFPETGISGEDLWFSITSSKGEHGDLSSSISLKLARIAKRSPKEIAELLVKKMPKNKLISGLEQLNGYINAWLSEVEYSNIVISSVLNEKERYGSVEIGRNKTVIVEYPSVNPNKPWHIGHLRNALLGDSLSNIFAFCKYRVEREDYIDDLGLQMAEILWGIENIGLSDSGKYDQALGKLYVEVNKRAGEKGVKEGIERLLRRMEKSGSKEAKKIRAIAERSVMAQYETGFAYEIYHDILVWESDIVREKLLDSALQVLEERRIIKIPKSGKYKGCKVFKFGNSGDEAGEEEEAKVLIRSNGVATYLAKDLAFHMWKFGLFGPRFRYKPLIMQPNGRYVYSTSASGDELRYGNAQLAVNIIGSTQKHPQKILKELFNAMGYSQMAENLIHIAYGEVGLKEGSLSGRSGGWLGYKRDYTADVLLKEVTEKAFGIIKSSGKIKERKEMEMVSRRTALSAIKFEFLRLDPEKKVVFDWDRALDFNSNSGPYCMYVYARASRILEKAGTERLRLEPRDFGGIGRGEEFELIKLIGLAEEAVEKACTERKPNIVAEYVLELSLQFSRFYERVPVLKSGDARNVRLAIVFATKQVIYNMLGLLGIEALERM